MMEIEEETLFFALSYVIGRTYSAVSGGRLSHDVADSIAFAILDDWKRNNWCVFAESVEQPEANYRGTQQPNQANTLASRRQMTQDLRKRWRKRLM
jgi:hypothetical protein